MPGMGAGRKSRDQAANERRTPQALAHPTRDPLRLAAYFCFFLSGVAGLIAEICWIRRAALGFGSTSLALSTVLAVFFAGLAVGSVVFGERSPRIARPLRLYAVLELLLAVAVVATLPLFDVAESVFGHAYRATAASGIGTAVVRVVLVACVLIIPTFIMGGTLPLFCRQFVATESGIGRTVGALYGINTLGAAIGAALCGFVLLPTHGLRGSLLVAATLQILAGALGALVGWNRDAAGLAAPSPPATVKHVRAGDSLTADRIAFALFFVCGLLALGNEVLWTRFLALIVRTTVFTYALTLSVTLLGIVIGTWLATLIAASGRNTARAFGLVLALGAVTALAVPLLPPAIWRASDLSSYGLLLLPAAVLSGAALPLTVRIVVHDPQLAGVGVGRMLAANTAGGIVGSLAIGFIVLPRWGLQVSLLATTGLALLAAFVAWWRLDRNSTSVLRLTLTLASLGAWLALPSLLTTRIPQDYLAEPGHLVDFREGREANLAVVRRNGMLHLEADRWWQGQDRPSHQMLAAHVPLILHAAPRRVLVVGVGAGQTPANVLAHDVEHLDCIDIEPATFDLVRAHFAPAWLDDPRATLLTDDGRNYIAHATATYDVISLEVGQLFRPGIADFYTAEFYRRARARLAPGGVLSQLVPLPFLSVEDFRNVIATFVDAFPQSILWYNTSELLLIGTNDDRFVLRPDRLQTLTTSHRVNAALRYSYWGGPSYWLNQPSVFLAGFLMGSRGLAEVAREGQIERDDHPRLPYSTRAASALAVNELALLDVLRPQLESIATIMPSPLPPHTAAAIARVRERNLDDIVASAALRQVEALVAAREYAAVATQLERAREANPDNVQARRLAADLALYQGRTREAEEQYEQTLALSPGDAAAHLGLARALQIQQRAVDAVMHYRAALSQQAFDADTYITYGGALAATGDAAGAEQSFRDALAVDAASAAAHNNLAIALSQRGDDAGARQHLQAALRLRPDYAEARQNLQRLGSR